MQVSSFGGGTGERYVGDGGRPKPSPAPSYSEPSPAPSTGNGDSISMSASQLEANAKALRESSESIKTSWNDIINVQINNLQNSWAGPDAKEYIEKVTPFGEKINATCESIELLASTFEQARNELIETQNELARQISSM